MRYYLSILLCAFLLLQLSAQKESRSSFGIYLTPKVTTPIFADPNLGQGAAELGINLAISYNYQVTQHILLGMGLKFSNEQANYRDNTFWAACDRRSDGTVDFDRSYLTTKNDLTYLGIPVEVRLLVDELYPIHYLRLSYELSYLTGESNDTKLTSNCPVDFSLNFPFQYDNSPRPGGSKASFGIGFALDRGARFIIEPEIAYGLINLHYRRNFDSRPDKAIRLLDIGLRLGVQF